MIAPIQNIKELHSAWNKATGQSLPLCLYDYEREYGWLQFIKAGYSETDIVFVVDYLKQEIKAGKRKQAALRWSNCIGNLCRFAEEMELARGAARNKRPTPTPREQVLREFRPEAVETQPAGSAKPIGFYIEQMRLAASARA